MKKTNMIKLGTYMSFGFILLLLMVQPILAAWSPAETELAASKDTYVSISGPLSDPTANYGLAGNLYVGKGIDGVCVSAIQFDLSQLPENVETLEFVGDVTVYGSNTRKIMVSVLIGQDWEELEVTGLNNPFNATDLWINGDANLTTKTIGGSTTELSVDLDTVKEESGLITLIFVPELTEESWLTMRSQENEYLSAYSNPPRLSFTTTPDLVDNGDGDGAGASAAGFLILVVIIVGVVIFLKKRK